jgi:hypothetical protein
MSGDVSVLCKVQYEIIYNCMDDLKTENAWEGHGRLRKS